MGRLVQVVLFPYRLHGQGVDGWGRPFPQGLEGTVLGVGEAVLDVGATVLSVVMRLPTGF